MPVFRLKVCPPAGDCPQSTLVCADHLRWGPELQSRSESLRSMRSYQRESKSVARLCLRISCKDSSAARVAGHLLRADNRLRILELLAHSAALVDQDSSSRRYRFS